MDEKKQPAVLRIRLRGALAVFQQGSIRYLEDEVEPMLIREDKAR